MFALTSAVVVLAVASKAFADPSPLTPATANVGAQCTITWSPDTTGKWTQTNIQLMTGDNWNMVPITTIATVDTTSTAATTYTYTCPDVTPNAPIYFYQFSHAAEPTNLVWTTRFTIAGADGSTVAAENQTQPDGQNIPWGTGALTDPSTAKPAPSYITGQGPAPATASGSAVASMSSMTMSMSSAAASSAVVSSSTRLVTSAVSSASAAAKTSSASASATASANGSGRVSAKGVAYTVGAVAAAGLLALA